MFDDLAIWNWINLHRMLQKAIKEFATVLRSAPVKTESKFIEIIV